MLDNSCDFAVEVACRQRVHNVHGPRVSDFAVQHSSSSAWINLYDHLRGEEVSHYEKCLDNGQWWFLCVDPRIQCLVLDRSRYGLCSMAWWLKSLSAH